MKNIIKICGLSSDEAIDTALAGGASHLGFVFFAKSPRHLSIEKAQQLVSGVEGAETVAVTVDAAEEVLDEIVAVMKPSMLQLHGKESAARVLAIRQKYALPLIKAFAIHTQEDLEQVQAYEGAVDYFLFDAKAPQGSALPGGNGVQFDWSVLQGFCSKTPFILSGGIGLENAHAAMQLVRRHDNGLCGLDISSGVESRPGVKDNEKIKAFLKTCRASVASE